MQEPFSGIGKPEPMRCYRKIMKQKSHKQLPFKNFDTQKAYIFFMEIF